MKLIREIIEMAYYFGFSTLSFWSLMFSMDMFLIIIYFGYTIFLIRFLIRLIKELKNEKM